MVNVNIFLYNAQIKYSAEDGLYILNASAFAEKTIKPNPMKRCWRLESEMMRSFLLIFSFVLRFRDKRNNEVATWRVQNSSWHVQLYTNSNGCDFKQSKEFALLLFSQYSNWFLNFCLLHSTESQSNWAWYRWKIMICVLIFFRSLAILCWAHFKKFSINIPLKYDASFNKIAVIFLGKHI